MTAWSPKSKALNSQQRHVKHWQPSRRQYPSNRAVLAITTFWKAVLMESTTVQAQPYKVKDRYCIWLITHHHE